MSANYLLGENLDVSDQTGFFSLFIGQKADNRTFLEEGEVVTFEGTVIFRWNANSLAFTC